MNRHIRITLDKVGANPFLFNLLQKLCNLGDLRKDVAARLRVEPRDSILDVGCGTGLYSTLAKSRYLGVDLNESYIKYARLRHKDRNKTFIVQDITKLNLGDEMFDKTLYMAMLHHFHEEDNLKILKKIASITRKMILILDLTVPNNPTAIQKFFLTVERGKYVRSLKDQIRIIEKILDIGNVSLVFNRTRFGLFSIIESYPRNSQMKEAKEE